MSSEWFGGNPYYLMIVPDGGPPPIQLQIDLDSPGWLARLKEEIGEKLDAPGEWHLVRKEGAAVAFSLRVNTGDQPYYTARHIGVAGSGGNTEVIAYGIGKKSFRNRKGTWHDNEDNLWVLPWGQVCGGTDVEHFALEGMKRGLR